MAKIHKSTTIYLDSSTPKVINMPYVSEGLNNLEMGKEDGNTIKEPASKKDHLHSVESYYVESVISSATQEADAIIDKARNEAKRIEKEAKKNAEIIYEHSSSEGFNSGVEKALFDLESFKKDLKKEMKNEISKLGKEAKRDLEEIEKEIIDISFIIAGKIVCYELEKDDKAIKAMISDVLDGIKDRKGLKIIADQRDIEKISSIEHVKESDIKVTNSKDFDNHQCVIEALTGKIDLSWQKKMDKLLFEVKGET